MINSFGISIAKKYSSFDLNDILKSDKSLFVAMTIISEDIVSKLENDLTILRMKINLYWSPIEKVICGTFSLTDFLYNVQSVERAVKVTSEALRLVYGQHDFFNQSSGYKELFIEISFFKAILLHFNE